MHSSRNYLERLELLPSHGRSAIFFLVAQIFQIQTSLAWTYSGEFMNYPLCAQPCLLEEAAASGCPDSTMTTLAASNACLCSSVSFLTAVAICTNTSCGSDFPELGWDTASANCRDTGSNIVLSRRDTIALASPIIPSNISSSTKIITSTRDSSSIPPVPTITTSTIPVTSTTAIEPYTTTIPRPTSTFTPSSSIPPATKITTSTALVTRTTAIEPSTTILRLTSTSTPSSTSRLTGFSTSIIKDLPTTAAPSSTSSKPQDVNVVDGPNLSRGDKIALGVGLGVGLPTIIITILKKFNWGR